MTFSEHMLDVVTVTSGPKRFPDEYFPWISGVTLLLDARVPFGAIVVKGLLQSHAITLPIQTVFSRQHTDI